MPIYVYAVYIRMYTKANSQKFTNDMYQTVNVNEDVDDSCAIGSDVVANHLPATLVISHLRNVDWLPSVITVFCTSNVRNLPGIYSETLPKVSYFILV